MSVESPDNGSLLYNVPLSVCVGEGVVGLGLLWLSFVFIKLCCVLVWLCRVIVALYCYYCYCCLT